MTALLFLILRWSIPMVSSARHSSLSQADAVLPAGPTVDRPSVWEVRPHTPGAPSAARVEAEPRASEPEPLESLAASHVSRWHERELRPNTRPPTSDALRLATSRLSVGGREANASTDAKCAAKRGGPVRLPMGALASRGDATGDNGRHELHEPMGGHTSRGTIAAAAEQAAAIQQHHAGHEHVLLPGPSTRLTPNKVATRIPSDNALTPCPSPGEKAPSSAEHASVCTVAEPRFPLEAHERTQAGPRIEKGGQPPSVEDSVAALTLTKTTNYAFQMPARARVDVTLIGTESAHADAHPLDSARELPVAGILAGPSPAAIGPTDVVGGAWSACGSARYALAWPAAALALTRMSPSLPKDVAELAMCAPAHVTGLVDVGRLAKAALGLPAQLAELPTRAIEACRKLVSLPARIVEWRAAEPRPPRAHALMVGLSGDPDKSLWEWMAHWSGAEDAVGTARARTVDHRFYGVAEAHFPPARAQPDLAATAAAAGMTDAYTPHSTSIAEGLGQVPMAMVAAAESTPRQPPVRGAASAAAMAQLHRRPSPTPAPMADTSVPFVRASSGTAMAPSAFAAAPAMRRDAAPTRSTAAIAPPVPLNGAAPLSTPPPPPQLLSLVFLRQRASALGRIVARAAARRAKRVTFRAVHLAFGSPIAIAQLVVIILALRDIRTLWRNLRQWIRAFARQPMTPAPAEQVPTSAEFDPPRTLLEPHSQTVAQPGGDLASRRVAAQVRPSVRVWVPAVEPAEPSTGSRQVGSASCTASPSWLFVSLRNATTHGRQALTSLRRMLASVLPVHGEAMGALGGSPVTPSLRCLAGLSGAGLLISLGAGLGGPPLMSMTTVLFGAAWETCSAVRVLGGSAEQP